MSRTSVYLLCVLLGAASAMGAELGDEEQPVGWASVEGGTKGGRGGETVTARDAESFVKYAESAKPLVVQVAGTIRLSRPVRVAANKTIVGLAADARLEGGGLTLVGVSNVVIRNLSISGADDAINLEKNTHHVWIDHCDLSNCRDGLIDIKRGSDLVTVSWNRFHDHGKTCLVGHSDKDDIRRMDTGHLRITYHHNFFDGSGTRHPRVRFAEPVHVFNNYFARNEYGVASVMDAGVLVEGNVFDEVKHPTHTQYGDSPDPGRLVERDNIYVDSGRPETRGTVVEPGRFYKYALDKTADVAHLVRTGAGVGKLSQGDAKTAGDAESSVEEQEVRTLLNRVRGAGFYALRDPEEKAAIAKLRAMPERAAPAVAELLVEGHANRKRGWIEVYRPLYILEGMGEHAAVAMPEIVKALDDEHPINSLAAARVLADIGPKAKSAVPALLKARERAPESSQAVCKAIDGAIKTLDPEAAKAAGIE